MDFGKYIESAANHLDGMTVYQENISTYNITISHLNSLEQLLKIINNHSYGRIHHKYQPYTCNISFPTLNEFSRKHLFFNHRFVRIVEYNFISTTYYALEYIPPIKKEVLAYCFENAIEGQMIVYTTDDFSRRGIGFIINSDCPNLDENKVLLQLKFGIQ